MQITRRRFVSTSALITTYCCSSLRSGLAQVDEPLRNLQVCTEIVMSDIALASAYANDENPANVPVDPSTDQAEAISLYQKKWHPDRRILNVDFIDPPLYVDKIVHYAKEWENYMGMEFRFGGSEPEILIAFDPGGSWSFVGTDSVYYSRRGRPSMNFGWFDHNTQDQEFRRTTLHEFGHALALVHEHQSPYGQISWDKDAVYSYYKNIGWDRTQVDRQIFGKYALGQINGSTYDRHSIMHYPIPVELVQDDADAVGWNSELSESDKIVIAHHYPKLAISLPRG